MSRYPAKIDLRYKTMPVMFIVVLNFNIDFGVMLYSVTIQSCIVLKNDIGK